MVLSCYYCPEKPNRAPSGYKSVWCKKHATPKSIHSDRIRCKIQKCKKIPKYGYHGEKIATLCYLHKEPSMIDITATICTYQNCIFKSVSGGSDNVPKYCRKHATANYNIEVQRCAYMTCRNIPEKKYKFIFCKEHFIKGNADVCLLCTNLVSDGFYCINCSNEINIQNTRLFDNIDIAAMEYRLVSNNNQEIDSLLKQEINFSVKLDYVPVDLLLNELDLLDNTFDFIKGIPEISHEPYAIYDHIDIPDM